MYDEDFTEEASVDDAVDKFMGEAEDDTDLSEDEREETEAEDDESEDQADDEADDDEDESDEDPDDSEDEDDSEDDEESEEDDEEGDDEEPKVADEDAVVDVTVDGENQRVSVKDLKRLAGQEASLTQKAQSVSEQRRSVEAQGQYLAKLLQSRYENAKAEADKYKDVDLFRASRELEPDEFDSLRKAKENAESEVQALEREGQEFLQNTQKMKQQYLKEQANQSLKVITEQIPEWSDELYGQIRTYAISQGMDKEIVNETVDPGAILMMHKAMKYDNAQKSTEKVKKQVKKAPKKTTKKSAKPTDNKTSKLNAKRKQAMENGGDVDDITDLFLAAAEE